MHILKTGIFLNSDFHELEPNKSSELGMGVKIFLPFVRMKFTLFKAVLPNKSWLTFAIVGIVCWVDCAFAMWRAQISETGVLLR